MRRIGYLSLFCICQVFAVRLYADTITLSGFPDTYIVMNTDSTPESQPTMVVEGYHCGACIDQRALIRFDLGSLGSNATIGSAKLMLFSPAQPRPGAGTIRAYKITRNWVPSEANWFNATKSTTWAKAGGDYDAIAGATLKYGIAVNVWHTLDVTVAVKDFTANPASNYGLLLKLDPVMYTVMYVSSQGAVASQRPKLVIVYSGGTALAKPSRDILRAMPGFRVAGSRITVSFPDFGRHKLLISDLNGKVVLSRDVTGPEFLFELPNSSGSYIIGTSGEGNGIRKMVTIVR